MLSIVLPAISLPLLYLCAIAANRFTTHDDFFNGELVPGIIGCCILLAIACMLCGLPLGILGVARRERARWMSAIGPVWSIGIFAYLQLMQFIAAG